MDLIQTLFWRVGASSLLVAVGLLALQQRPTESVHAQESTPAAYSCGMVDAMATPAMDHGAMGEMAGMDAATPMSGMDMEMEFDQLYIDMMIPHHQSIIALAQAALPTLTDERLKEIAQDIISAQSAEIPELQGYRAQFYGSPEPAPMDDHMMAMMMDAMPGMGSMDEMSMQMDAMAQVASFCEAQDPDLAFIELTIPHHRMAIAASEMALTNATHQEIKDFAQKVIDAQQAEIDELTQIQAELTGEATPSS